MDNKLSVARVLVEYDVLEPSLLRIWIDEGDSNFCQDFFREFLHIMLFIGILATWMMVVMWLIIGFVKPSSLLAWLRVQVLRIRAKKPVLDAALQPQVALTAQYTFVTHNQHKGPSVLHASQGQFFGLAQQPIMEEAFGAMDIRISISYV